LCFRIPGAESAKMVAVAVPTTSTSRGFRTWTDANGRMNIYIPPHPTATTYRFSGLPTADGFTKVVEALDQEVGLQIRVNATSVQALDEWILLYDEGPRTYYIGSPQQGDNTLQ